MRQSYSEDVVRLMVDALTNTTSMAMVKVGPGDNNQWEKIFQCLTTLFSDPPPGLDSLKVCQLLHKQLRAFLNQGHAGGVGDRWKPCTKAEAVRQPGQVMPPFREMLVTELLTAIELSPQGGCADQNTVGFDPGTIDGLPAPLATGLLNPGEQRRPMLGHPGIESRSGMGKMQIRVLAVLRKHLEILPRSGLGFLSSAATTNISCSVASNKGEYKEHLSLKLPILALLTICERLALVAGNPSTLLCYISRSSGYRNIDDRQIQISKRDHLVGQSTSLYPA